jgi:hypothetical protein
MTSVLPPAAAFPKDERIGETKKYRKMQGPIRIDL